MSSNVGLSTPRGSGTSGYVQRNSAFLKPRNAGYGAPYPPVSSGDDRGSSSGFRQRKPDQQILDHDRKRAIEVQVLEERERLEEENEELEKELEDEDAKTDQKKTTKKKKEKRIPLTEEEIEERCNALRNKLLKDLEERENGPSSSSSSDRRDRRSGYADKERRQFKSYQVHELAEAKMEESERLRKALGIKEDWERKSSSAPIQSRQAGGGIKSEDDASRSR